MILQLAPPALAPSDDDRIGFHCEFPGACANPQGSIQTMETVQLAPPRWKRLRKMEGFPAAKLKHLKPN